MTAAERNLAAVLEHVRRENAHDLSGIMGTFGGTARYEDAPWADDRVGRSAVEGYYRELLRALPDLVIDIDHQTATEDRVILEVHIRGQHRGAWRGLPATGRSVDFPLCGVFTFDGEGKLAGERIYYDRGTVLRQLGMYHDPRSFLGRLEALIFHPLTLLKATLRLLGS